MRAKIILRAAAGEGHGEISRALGITKDTSRLWRKRWLELRDVEMSGQERLEDAGRSGKPASFTIEQLTQLYALACDPPQKYGRPISHWTPRELADELMVQKIVESISPRHVGRLLAEADLKPHQSGYWLHPPDPAFKTKVEDICEVYDLALERAERGELTFSLDEMTGIQALERQMPDIPMKTGRSVKVEFEYLRHGTQALIASFNVASGQIAQADVGDSRTEADLDIALRRYVRTLLKCSINTIAEAIKLIPPLLHPILEYEPPIFNLVEVWRIGR